MFTTKSLVQQPRFFTASPGKIRWQEKFNILAWVADGPDKCDYRRCQRPYPNRMYRSRMQPYDCFYRSGIEWQKPGHLLQEAHTDREMGARIRDKVWCGEAFTKKF